MSEWERMVLEVEGLANWKVEDASDGMVWFSQKKITRISEDKALFLHEVAHVLTRKWNKRMGDKTGHHSIWGDKFTDLVRKYLCSRFTPKKSRKLA